MANDASTTAASPSPISLFKKLHDQVVESQTAARKLNLADGKRLRQIRDGELFKGEYETFDAYIERALRPHGIGKTWVYLLMNVAGSFEEAHAAQFGLEALDQVCKITQEFFPGNKPSDLLTGRHEVVDPSGTVHVLDMSQDPSYEGLKAFRAACREGMQSKTPKKAADASAAALTGKGGAPTPEDARPVARRALDLLNAGKLDEWEQTLDSSCELASPGDTTRGSKAIRAGIEGLRRAFPDVRYVVESVHGEGDTALAEVTMTGKHTGILRTPRGDAQPTGKAIRIRQAHVIQVRNGKAVSIRLYFDRMELMAQLGL